MKLKEILKEAQTSKKLYIEVAKMLKTISLTPPEKMEVAERLGDIFYADNPRFDKNKFLAYIFGPNYKTQKGLPFIPITLRPTK